MSAATSADVVVVGAGIVGAACARALAAEGLSVTVVDRGHVAGGTTGAGEGNILVSDKGPGPELDLALLSRRLWSELGDVLPPEVELEAKGGLVVATSEAALAPLLSGAAAQREAGVVADEVAAGDLLEHEPHLADDLPGGVHYPQDMQVQPMLAAAHLLRLARESGALVLAGHQVVGIRRSATGAIAAVLTAYGEIPCSAVVNAAGSWGSEIAAMAGGPIPVMPRRGFVLVTEPLPRVVRQKVYSADYVANVASGAEGLETSAVVEGTASGPVLIGASRERVGFDRTMSYEVLGRLAQQAVRLFPALASVRVQRAYRGFRPYCPDHLPVIGPDPRVPGLFHACGHEGAGVGLAPATALLIAQSLTGTTLTQSLEPFSPLRFSEAA
ncbi:MAG TPA: FAD-dependent oxidoreductase [Candidatus Nanopelagicales bacterium]|jgi:glycine/D-amino acid oxidase-like deaminating enzyme